MDTSRRRRRSSRAASSSETKTSKTPEKAPEKTGEKIGESAAGETPTSAEARRRREAKPGDARRVGRINPDRLVIERDALAAYRDATLGPLHGSERRAARLAAEVVGKGEVSSSPEGHTARWEKVSMTFTPQWDRVTSLTYEPVSMQSGQVLVHARAVDTWRALHLVSRRDAEAQIRALLAQAEGEVGVLAEHEGRVRRRYVLGLYTLWCSEGNTTVTDLTVDEVAAFSSGMGQTLMPEFVRITHHAVSQQIVRTSDANRNEAVASIQAMLEKAKEMPVPELSRGMDGTLSRQYMVDGHVLVLSPAHVALLTTYPMGWWNPETVKGVESSEVFVGMRLKEQAAAACGVSRDGAEALLRGLLAVHEGESALVEEGEGREVRRYVSRGVTLTVSADNKALLFVEGLEEITPAGLGEVFVGEGVVMHLCNTLKKSAQEVRELIDSAAAACRGQVAACEEGGGRVYLGEGLVLVLDRANLVVTKVLVHEGEAELRPLSREVILKDATARRMAESLGLDLEVVRSQVEGVLRECEGAWGELWGEGRIVRRVHTFEGVGVVCDLSNQEVVSLQGRRPDKAGLCAAKVVVERDAAQWVAEELGVEDPTTWARSLLSAYDGASHRLELDEEGLVGRRYAVVHEGRVLSLVLRANNTSLRSVGDLPERGVDAGRIHLLDGAVSAYTQVSGAKEAAARSMLRSLLSQVDGVSGRIVLQHGGRAPVRKVLIGEEWSAMTNLESSVLLGMTHFEKGEGLSMEGLEFSSRKVREAAKRTGRPEEDVLARARRILALHEGEKPTLEVRGGGLVARRYEGYDPKLGEVTVLLSPENSKVERVYASGRLSLWRRVRRLFS